MIFLLNVVVGFDMEMGLHAINLEKVDSLFQSLNGEVHNPNNLEPQRRMHGDYLKVDGSYQVLNSQTIAPILVEDHLRRDQQRALIYRLGIGNTSILL